MKRLIFIAVLIFGFVGYAFAGPFLVCDPPDPASAMPTYYEVWEDDVLWLETVLPQPDYSIYYDMTGHPITGHTYKAKACNDGGCSGFSNQWPPAIPDTPVMLRIVP